MAARQETRALVKTIIPQDYEFAASSGANVNALPDRSFVDYPPNSTRDLTITSNMGDDRPFYFDRGETYDLTWSGHGGGVIEDAVIIRSDNLAPGQGVVVFQGTNSNTGELAQIVWSPGFDLENWYWSNGGSPAEDLAFWTSDQDAEQFHHICFAAGTQIQTPGGDIPVEQLAVGDRVTTLDHGPQPVLWVGRDGARGAALQTPVVFKPAAMGNPRCVAVSQNQRILLRGAHCETLFAAPEVLVPAKALVNGATIVIEPRPGLEYFHLLMERHEILIADGLETESLFLGDMALGAVEAQSGSLPKDALLKGAKRSNAQMIAARPLLTFREGRTLAYAMGLAEPTDMDARRPIPLAVA